MSQPDLLGAARQFGTPLYVYDLDAIRARFDVLHEATDGRFGISFAVKANPNVALLSAMASMVDSYDVSSFAEVERALAAGCPAERITFSGPAKREEEIRRAVRLGVGELVCESLRDARLASRHAQEFGVRQTVLLRINPAATPRHAGIAMAGKPSQFGIDEEDMGPAIKAILALPHLQLAGFHVYSATNSLSVEAIAGNFAISADIFRRASAYLGRPVAKLIFGAGFGLPYLPTEEPLDMAVLGGLIGKQADALRAEPQTANAAMVLELGRWLTGPCGWLLSSIIAEKHSRGVDIRLCDAGFNNHLAAYGMMGSVIRRNWRIANISRPDASVATCTIVGPLCTSIDTLATKITLPALQEGDVIAIENSGAYGVTASPTRFISHPEPREVIAQGGTLREVTESRLNHWRLGDN